jgi:hypothetical protein
LSGEGPAASRKFPSINFGSPEFWSDTGEGIVTEELGLSFVGIAEEQKNWKRWGMTDNDRQYTGNNREIPWDFGAGK